MVCLDASEIHFKETGKSLFSSHMIDLSEEPIEENIEICKSILKARMSKMGMTLEIELVLQVVKKMVLTIQMLMILNYTHNQKKLLTLTKN